MPQYFPQEIWYHILLYLPVISLCRFNLVSKSFYALITSPDFISTHIIKSLNKKNNIGNIVLECSSSNNHGNLNLENLAILVRRYIGYDQDNYTLIQGSPNLSDLSRLFQKEIVFPHGSQQGDYKIVGSGYGLMCFEPILVDKIILWNPSIRKSVTLPEPLIRHSPHSRVVVGSGVDSVSSDFKVVRILFGELITGASRVVTWEPSKAEVYSLKRNEWRKLVEPNIRSVVLITVEPVMLNGSPHWLAGRSRLHGSSIFTFDMSTEAFGYMMAPAELGLGDRMQLCYNLSRETPTIVEYFNIGPNNRRSCSIWVMMEYGVVESWKKMCSFDLVPGMGQVIGFQEEGCEVLVSRTGKELVVYEIETGFVKELGIFGSASSFLVNRYMESLLLLKNNLLGE